jgi:hypothetical protein
LSLPSFPVVSEEPARTRGIGGLGSMQNLLLNTPYIFAAWVHFWTLNGAPTLNFVQLPNANGNLVYPNETTIVAAITNHKGPSTDLYIMLAEGVDSYPMVTFNAFMVRTETMPDYAKAQALVDWYADHLALVLPSHSSSGVWCSDAPLCLLFRIYWTQTDATAAQIARSYVSCCAISVSVKLGASVLPGGATQGQHGGGFTGSAGQGHAARSAGQRHFEWRAGLLARRLHLRRHRLLRHGHMREGRLRMQQQPNGPVL